MISLVGDLRENKAVKRLALWPRGSAFSPFVVVVDPWFLDAPSHLYKRVCPSVRPSVRLSVRPSVTHKFKPCKSAICNHF